LNKFFVEPASLQLQRVTCRIYTITQCYL